MGNGTLSQEVYARLRGDIRNGTLRPGSTLRLDALTSRYGIGATPMREALSRLSAEYLVSSKDRRGFRVAPISLQEFTEIISLREDLEHKALLSSIQNGDDAWEAEIVARLHTLSKITLLDALRDQEANEARETRHRAFHVALIAACESSWLLRIWGQLSEHEERYRRIATASAQTTKENSDAVEDEHRRLCDAVLSRDADKAWSILQPHRRRTIAAVRKLFHE